MAQLVFTRYGDPSIFLVDVSNLSEFVMTIKAYTPLGFVLEGIGI